MRTVLGFQITYPKQCTSRVSYLVQCCTDAFLQNIDSSCSDFEEEQKELSMAFVKRSLTIITEIMDQIVENDPNFDRSSKSRRGFTDGLSTCQQHLTECRRKKQTTVDAFLTKRQKIGNTE